MSIYDRIIRARFIAKSGDISTARDILYVCEELARIKAEEDAIARAWQLIEQLD